MMYSDDNTMKGRYSCGTATSRMGFLLLLLGMPVQAWQPQGYAALALGLSAQSIPEERSDDGESDTLLTDLVYARGGIEWIPGVSTGLGLWLWGDKNINENAESPQFDGISAGWDVTLRLPLANGVGPWVRYGRHCWSTAVSGVLEPWSDDGCSTMRSAGFNFPLPNQHDVVLFAEYSTTEFSDIDADSIIAGVRAHF
ncbi:MULTISPECIES: hypothetical protein [unclassified Thalassolituus]|jgi:hypothetical protein|uniref:hypothetical protein n=1 Tax=Oceanospirillaceae TaxID=135620 RepID=UPI001191DC98|nr:MULTISPECIES: hypothetical protein [unclassified Thalassolituus]MBU2037827.1 hypothetical protein [Gammaproteobacteria bacterium]MCA6060390.1 hypothetical protein [Thalassolituus sp. ST750PaO-4]TVV42545.1 hypothetical protein FOT50_13775 [Thalassolituus sp. C2-1]